MPRVSRSSRVKMMRSRRGMGVLDGPLITQRARFSGMGKKRTYVSRMGMGKRRKRRGGSFLSQANDFIKRNRLISRIAGEVAKQQGTLGKVGRVVQSVARKYGYGQHMMPNGRMMKGRVHGGFMGGKRRKKRGGSIFSQINDFLKRNRVLSTIGGILTPLSGSFAPITGGLTAFARSQGYGQKRLSRGRGGNNPYPTTNSFYGKPIF